MTPIAARFMHASLAVDDIDASIAFYRAAFGFEVSFRVETTAGLIASVSGVDGLEGTLAQLRRPGDPTLLELIEFSGLHAPDTQRVDAPVANGHVAFATTDLDRAVVSASDLGARLVGQVTRFAEGRAVYLVEPGGTLVELEEDEAGGDVRVKEVELFVNGTLMQGLPLSGNLDGAELLGTAHTAPRYLLYSVEDRHPAMFLAEGGVSVSGERYRLTLEHLDRLLEGEPPGLGLGVAELDNGERTLAIVWLGERPPPGGHDISRHGGWRSYLSVAASDGSGGERGNAKTV